MQDLQIEVDDPRAPDVRELLEKHLAFARETSPPEHVHALGESGLLDPAVTLYSARRDGELLGVGAIRGLDNEHGEIKSMHTAAEARGQGVGRAIVDHLLSVAADSGYTRVSLETGTMEEFARARALYSSVGFEPCAPFAQYTVNSYSTCMTIDLKSSPHTD